MSNTILLPCARSRSRLLFSRTINKNLHTSIYAQSKKNRTERKGFKKVELYEGKRSENKANNEIYEFDYEDDIEKDIARETKEDIIKVDEDGFNDIKTGNSFIMTEEEYAKGLENEPEYAVRGTDEVKFGKKYIGMVELPKYLIEAADEYLADKDKKLLRTDTLRIFDSLRSSTLLFSKKSNKVDATRQYIDEKTFEIKNKENLQKTKIFSLLSKDVPLRPHVLEFGERESAAYLASRFPATYGVVYNVLHELKNRIPDFVPKTVLDFGCGPATSLWCLNELWGDKVEKYHGVDVSQQMLMLAESLIQSAGQSLAIKNTSFDRYISPKKTGFDGYDLVVSSFTLSELFNDGLRKSYLENLWEKTGDVLVLIDRGSPECAKHISDVRNYFISRIKSDSESENSFHFLAPCPHEKECPLEKTNDLWCHFSQRIQRPTMTMKSKHSKSNREDLRYSYLIIRRGARPKSNTVPYQQNVVSPELENHESANTNDLSTEANLAIQAFDWPRVILPAIKRGKHILVDVCSTSGNMERRIFTKSFSKQSFRDARKVNWGDLFPHAYKSSITKVDIEMENGDNSSAPGDGNTNKHTKNKAVDPSPLGAIPVADTASLSVRQQPSRFMKHLEKKKK